MNPMYDLALDGYGPPLEPPDGYYFLTNEQPAAPARKRYSFWVEFTPEDIAWFKQGAAERGFRYGSVK